MAVPWQVEREVSAELAAVLIAGQFGILGPRSIEPFGVGFDNTAFLVNNEWVFRFPRRQAAVECIEAETRALPALAGRLALPVPFPDWRGAASERFPWPFSGYRLLSGRTACGVDPGDDQRRRSAAVLAEFLRGLHDTPHAALVGCDVPLDRIRRLDVAYRAPRLLEHLNRIAALGLITSAQPWVAVLDDTPIDWRPRGDTLVHGDLYARHLLLDNMGWPCGVIDWGDLHFGDAAVDLSLAHSYLPPHAHAEFRAAYGAIDDAAWRVARFKALFTAVMIGLYGHDVGDRALVAAGLKTMAFIAGG